MYHSKVMPYIGKFQQCIMLLIHLLSYSSCMLNLWILARKTPSVLTHARFLCNLAKDYQSPDVSEKIHIQYLLNNKTWHLQHTILNSQTISSASATTLQRTVCPNYKSCLFNPITHFTENTVYLIHTHQS
jgi:hypothetical protein